MKGKRLPKRRTAKQAAASKRNLVKARAARKGSAPIRAYKAEAADRGFKMVPKPTPMGKNVLLFHQTNPVNATRIAKTKTWKPDNSYMKGNVSFTTAQGVANFGHYGKSVVSVRVPRKAILDKANQVNPGYGGIHEFTVPAKALQGRKVRKYTETEAKQVRAKSQKFNQSTRRYFK
jgi:hypothetical protein